MSKTIDLETILPRGWKETGISHPFNDGANNFRFMSEDYSLPFFIEQSSFVRIRYQPFLPKSNIVVSTYLDKTLLKQTYVKAGSAETRFENFYVYPGRHTFNIHFQCTVLPSCDVATLRQYFMQAVIYPTNVQQRDLGIGLSRLNLNAPGTQIKVLGKSHLEFDGVNPYLYAGSPLHLIWSKSLRVIKLNTQVFSEKEDFDIVLISEDKTSTVKHVEHGVFTNVTLSLVDFPQTGRVYVNLVCKTTKLNCFPVRFYTTSIDFLTPEHFWGLNYKLYIPFCIILLIIFLVALSRLLAINIPGSGNTPANPP